MTYGASEIKNTEATIDSRDIIARIEYLKDERSLYIEDHENEENAGDVYDEDHPDETDELATLEALAEECENDASDWESGATLIRDSYFEEYAEQTAEDLGYIDPNASWPLNHIDWAAAATELQQDYSQVDFDGVTYWVR